MNKTVNHVEEKVKIPTYVTFPDEKNPIFFEKRNVQGAAGNVFPMAMCDRIEAEYKPVEYNQIRLENEYIDITMLPEIGGRIYTAVDKKTGYDFIYRNNTIKPAQIGLCGPWISGGIEFNWPQHHRPTTFKNVDYSIEENEDSSKTVWMGEIEPLNRTKGMVGVTVYPGKSYIQAKVRLFNRTPYPQTFLWWANLAVAVNKDYRAVFPEDIHWASDHAWALTSKFPVIDGMYKNVDMGEGVDVRDFPNLEVGTSFFTYNSKYDFLSGFDFGKDAGIVHIADRHISPGKKMFTWGVSEFSDAWFNNLSDGDGPYVELMTGIYTCNQPDFSWIMPYEYKTAEQYWYPIREIGEVKSANINGAIGFELCDDKISFVLNVTEKRENTKIVITHNDKIIYEKIAFISPDEPFKDTAEITGEYLVHELEITVYSCDGKKLVSYRPENFEGVEVPKPLDPAPSPAEINDAEELYIHGLHIWQYRHPYFDSMDYINRALEINPNHIAANNLAGKILMERGELDKAKALFETAVSVATKRNPNPYDTEPYYNLGILLKLMGNYDEAYEKLFRSIWVFANKSSGYLAIAEIDCIRGDFEAAIEHIEESINSNGTNFKALKLKAMILRKLGKYEDAICCLDTIYKYDKLDFIALYEKSLVLKCIENSQYEQIFSEFSSVMRNIPEYYIDIAIDYANAGFYQDAVDVLNLYTQRNSNPYPMVEYYKGYYLALLGDISASKQVLKLASGLSIDNCLHSRLESIAVLEYAISNDDLDNKAPYLLGNIYYGKKTFMKGIEAFECSVNRNADFPTAYRNLAIGYFDKLGKVEEAGKLIEKAFQMDTTDARIFFELIQYYRNINVDVEKRLKLMEKHIDLADISEDIYIKLISTYMEAKNYKKAKELLEIKTFHPYEGGENVVSQEYVNACHLEGNILFEKGEYEKALEMYIDASKTLANFNMGKIPVFYQHAHIDYYIGIAYEKLGDTKKAKEYFGKSVRDSSNMPEMAYYIGLSYDKLGEKNKAVEKYNYLISVAKMLIDNDGKYPYFTKSLVFTLPFEHDTSKNDRATSHYYAGLGYKGLGEMQKSSQEFDKALELKTTMYMAREFLTKNN